jgi:hypothetical protein
MRTRRAGSELDIEGHREATAGTAARCGFSPIPMRVRADVLEIEPP